MHTTAPAPNPYSLRTIAADQPELVAVARRLSGMQYRHGLQVAACNYGAELRESKARLSRALARSHAYDEQEAPNPDAPNPDCYPRWLHRADRAYCLGLARGLRGQPTA